MIIKCDEGRFLLSVEQSPLAYCLRSNVIFFIINLSSFPPRANNLPPASPSCIFHKLNLSVEEKKKEMMNLQRHRRQGGPPLLGRKIILEIRRRNSTICANLAAHIRTHTREQSRFGKYGSPFSREHTFSAISSTLPPSRVSRTRHNLTNKYISARSFAPRENHGLKERETGGGRVLHNARNARTRRFHFSRKLNSPLGVRAKERAKTNPSDC